MARSPKLAVGPFPAELAPVKAEVRLLRRNGETLVDTMQRHIGSTILSGALAPGEKLGISSLAQAYEVSLSVMREALTRLVADGLVTSEPMHGFRVVEATLVDLEELEELFKLLASAALRHAIEHGGHEWEARLIAAQHLLRRAVETPFGAPDRQATIDEAHGELMRALTSACDNTRLLALLESLYRANRLYHRMAVKLFVPVENQRVAECDAIVQAAVAREADRAVSLLIAQSVTVTDAVRDHLAQTQAQRASGHAPSPSRGQRKGKLAVAGMSRAERVRA